MDLGIAEEDVQCGLKILCENSTYMRNEAKSLGFWGSFWK